MISSDLKTMVQEQWRKEFRELMILHDLKAPDVAAILGISVSSVSQYRSGTLKTPKAKLDALKKYLNVTKEGS